MGQVVHRERCSTWPTDTPARFETSSPTRRDTHFYPSVFEKPTKTRSASRRDRLGVQLPYMVWLLRTVELSIFHRPSSVTSP